MSNESWRIKGEYFESCNCELLCPCLLSHAQARPTEGHCDVVLAIHIASGTCGEVDLSGLNAVQALTTPGPMAQGDGTLAVYVDSRANEAQRQALEAIFTGNTGGPPSLLTGMIAHRLPTKAVPISFSSDGKTYKLSMAGISEVTVEGVAGAATRPYGSRMSAIRFRRNWPPPKAPRAASRIIPSPSTIRDATVTFPR
jgi:hypothetical protein